MILMRKQLDGRILNVFFALRCHFDISAHVIKGNEESQELKYIRGHCAMLLMKYCGLNQFETSEQMNRPIARIQYERNFVTSHVRYAHDKIRLYELLNL
jgi:uncharacterized membrane-anchored protein